MSFRSEARGHLLRTDYLCLSGDPSISVLPHSNNHDPTAHSVCALLSRWYELFTRAAEVAHQLRALAALSKDQNSIPSTHMVARSYF